MSVLDEERAINAFPKLLGATLPNTRRRSMSCTECSPARGALSDEGKRTPGTHRGAVRREAAKPTRKAGASAMPDAAEHRPVVRRQIRAPDQGGAAAGHRSRLPLRIPATMFRCTGAVEAARLHLIEPILVGPAERIRGVAARAGLDIGAMELVGSEHSHDFGGQGGGAGDRRPGRGLDEGQPAHRRADGRRGVAAGGHSDGPPDQPLLHHGCAEPSRCADHHGCRSQYRADARRQG